MNVAVTAVAVAIAAASPASQVVGVEDFADLMAESEITEQTDLGTAIVYGVTHPTLGNLILVNTTGERNLVRRVA